MTNPVRSLATVLFTDIVGSTERAAELRDAGWRELRSEHDRQVRRALRRFGGREISTAGDSFLATFDRPASAIACADAIRSRVGELGLKVRAGLHMGEIERVGGDVGGLGVNIGARVAAEAGPGEILVSRSLHDALAGSAFDFEDRGVWPLKGVPGEWRLFAVTGVPETAVEPTTPWSRLLVHRRAILAGFLAAGLVLLAGLYLARRDATSHLTPEEAAAAEEAALAANAAPGIAVLPFTVNDPALETWREGMVDLLSVNLDGVSELRAIDSRTVLARWAETVPDTARADLATSLAVARRTGARYALVGSVVAAGPDLRLTADVYEARGGTRLGYAQVVGAPDSILGLVDRLTREILRALPREGSVLAEVNLAELTTDSLAALKAFLNGEALYRRADFKAAGAAFELAIESDSLFALPWARLEDSCGWGSDSKLCGRNPPWDRNEFLSRLPARRADLQRAYGVLLWGAREGIEALWEVARKYPDDPDAWYRLGEGYLHWGPSALADPAEGVPAFERAITLAPTTSAEPYIHLIEDAFHDADSARTARFLDAYERITRRVGLLDPAFQLAFDLGFGDSLTRSRARAALDTVPTGIVSSALLHLQNPRFHGVTDEALRVLLARSDYSVATQFALYDHGRFRALLGVANNPVLRPRSRATLIYRLYQRGMHLPPEELERSLAAGAADTTGEVRFIGAAAATTTLFVGAYAVDRGQWDQYALAVDRQRARTRRYLAQGDSTAARSSEGVARALEGYALWKRGQKAEAILALEAAQPQISGLVFTVIPDETVRWWLAELMLEVGRLRDSKVYYRSLWPNPFVALRLGKVYEELDEFEKARASYEYALLSWQDADPELQLRIQEARSGLARLPKPVRRESQ